MESVFDFIVGLCASIMVIFMTMVVGVLASGFLYAAWRLVTND